MPTLSWNMYVSWLSFAKYNTWVSSLTWPELLFSVPAESWTLGYNLLPPSGLRVHHPARRDAIRSPSGCGNFSAGRWWDRLFVWLIYLFFSPVLKVRWNGQVMVRSPLLSVLPTVTGTCDQNQFYISVTYGSQGSNFQTIVGPRQLSPEMANAYNFQENATHFSLIVPYNAIDTAFEVCQETETPELNNFFFFFFSCKVFHSLLSTWNKDLHASE